MHQKLMNRRQSSHATVTNQKQPYSTPIRFLTSAKEVEDAQPAAASLGLSPTKFSRAQDWWLDDAGKHAL